jgi:hypothetical protein
LELLKTLIKFNVTKIILNIIGISNPNLITYLNTLVNIDPDGSQSVLTNENAKIRKQSKIINPSVSINFLSVIYITKKNMIL